MSILIYLHGLNSSQRSAKARELRRRLAPSQVLVPSYPAHRPRQAVDVLRAYFQGLSPSIPKVLIGSSMGGFYGQYLARHFPIAHLFLINPALTPWDLLRAHQGEVQTTALGESYLIDDAMLEGTKPFAIANPCDGVPTTLLLDKGDEVIDYRIAERIYRDCARLLIFEGGDHGFQHLEDAIAAIREELTKL